jgi:hypothetical protein
MTKSVFFMDCIQNQLRDIYCYEFYSSSYPTTDEWEEGNMLGGYGTTLWEQSKLTADQALKLKLVVPMPIANSKFSTGAKFPTITIYRRPENNPGLGTNDYLTYKNMRVKSKRNLHLGTFKIPNHVQPKVGRWEGRNETLMFVPTIVVLESAGRA